MIKLFTPQYFFLAWSSPRVRISVAAWVAVWLLPCLASQAQTFRIDTGSLRQHVPTRPPLTPDSLLRQEKKRRLAEFNRKRTDLQDTLSGRYQQRLSTWKGVFHLDSTWKNQFKLPPLVKFTTGQASLTQQVSERTGAYPVASPPTYTRFLFNGGADVLGIPLRLDALYSTEQAYQASVPAGGDASRNPLRQPMNRISVGFDSRQWQRTLTDRLNAKVLELETLSQSDGLKDLDQLYQLEELSGPNGLPSADLDQYLKKTTLLDSLKRAGAGLPRKARRKLEQARDSLYQVYTTQQQRRIGQAAGVLQSAKDSLGHRQGKLTTKARRYLDSHHLDAGKLARLRHLRDSLQRTNPERLRAYENLMVLKTIREEGVAKGMKRLKGLKLLSLPETLLGSVQSFSLGTSNPYYSRYTLRNVPVTGVHAELQPGLLHLAFTASKNLSAIPSNQTYARRLSAGSIGIGRKEENHFYLTFLHGMDDKTSFRGDSVINGFADTTFYNKPRENYVVSSEFKLRLSQRLSAEGELAHSVTGMNIYRRQVSGNEALQALFQSSADTSQVQTGRAYSLKLPAELDARTRLTLGGEYISDGFYSLGAPYLRNNLMGWDLKLERSFFKRQLTLAPKYGRMQTTQPVDSLLHTRMNVYGLKVKASFKKLPYLVLDYTSYRQQPSPTTELRPSPNQAASALDLLNLNGGYAYQLGATQVQSIVTLSHQRNHYRDPENPLNHSVSNLVFNQTASFSIPVQLSGNVSLMNTDTPQRKEEWVSVGGSLAYVFRGNWQSRIGLTQGQDQQEGRRQNWFVESRVNVWRSAELGARMERNSFEVGDLLRDYQELRGTVSLQVRW